MSLSPGSMWWCYHVRRWYHLWFRRYEEGRAVDLVQKGAAWLGGAGHPLSFISCGRAISFWIHLQLTGSALLILVHSSAASCVIHTHTHICIYIYTYIYTHRHLHMCVCVCPDISWCIMMYHDVSWYYWYCHLVMDIRAPHQLRHSALEVGARCLGNTFQLKRQPDLRYLNISRHLLPETERERER